MVSKKFQEMADLLAATQVRVQAHIELHRSACLEGQSDEELDKLALNAEAQLMKLLDTQRELYKLGRKERKAW